MMTEGVGVLVWLEDCWMHAAKVGRVKKEKCGGENREV